MIKNKKQKLNETKKKKVKIRREEKSWVAAKLQLINNVILAVICRDADNVL